MGIMARVIKIFKADMHGVMDQLEDQGLLLKQYLRDMEDALSAKEAALKRKIAARSQAQQEHDKFLGQIEALEDDLKVAISKNKDDIARMLIRKVKPLNDLRNDIAQRIRALDDEITGSRDHLGQLQLTYEQIKHRAVEYCHQTRAHVWQKDVSDMLVDSRLGELSEEEIELELLKRKAALGFTERVPSAFNGESTALK